MTIIVFFEELWRHGMEECYMAVFFATLWLDEIRCQVDNLRSLLSDLTKCIDFGEVDIYGR